jgi:outer membrane lipoprotein-sorting protein
MSLILSNLATAVTADELLKAADRSRGGLETGLEWNVEIESTEDGDTTTRKFAIKALDDDALAAATSPARNIGETFLFNDRTLWFYKPGLRKPVGISSRQKLTGQAANGDIASTHYSRDYEGQIIRQEKLGTENAFVLELKARNKDVTYDSIRYWIGEESRLGIKSEFLSLDGNILKTAEFTYDNSILVDGKKIPFVSRMVISDTKTKGNVSRLDYSSPKTAKLSKGAFNVNNLAR